MWRALGERPGIDGEPAGPPLFGASLMRDDAARQRCQLWWGHARRRRLRKARSPSAPRAVRQPALCQTTDASRQSAGEVRAERQPTCPASSCEMAYLGRRPRYRVGRRRRHTAAALGRCTATCRSPPFRPKATCRVTHPTPLQAPRTARTSFRSATPTRSRPTPGSRSRTSLRFEQRLRRRV